MQETYSDKLKKFESSNMLYSILQHIIDYFCIKHNLQYYNLSRLPRFVYTFYLMLGFFNKLTIDECNSLLNSKIKPELKKYYGGKKKGMAKVAGTAQTVALKDFTKEIIQY